jgi:hypothetical protein
MQPQRQLTTQGCLVQSPGHTAIVPLQQQLLPPLPVPTNHSPHSAPTCAVRGAVQLRAAARQLRPQLVGGLGVAHAPPPLLAQCADQAAICDHIGGEP